MADGGPTTVWGRVCLCTGAVHRHNRLRASCPYALYLELGCEVSEEAYLELRAQHERHDAELARLLLGAEQPAESVTPQSKRSKARTEVSPPVRSPDAPMRGKRSRGSRTR